MRYLRFLLDVICVVLLTAITQIGGVVFIVSRLVASRLKFRFRNVLTFMLLYVLTTFLIVPPLARVLGREPVNHQVNLKPANYLTVLLNRNYVTPDLNQTLLCTSQQLIQNNLTIELRYLDACFPFVKGFPLLPHFSHSDGKKIDFSLVYQDADANVVNASKSISGYGVFEEPKLGEFNQCLDCKSKGYWQYDFSKYLTFGTINNDLEFSIHGTKELLRVLLAQEELQKIFIEPNLVKRMGLQHPKLRFQGCGAVRHDDHIHMQIK